MRFINYCKYSETYRIIKNFHKQKKNCNYQLALIKSLKMKGFVMAHESFGSYLSSPLIISLMTSLESRFISILNEENLNINLMLN